MTQSKKNPYKNFPLHESLKDSYVDQRIMSGEKRKNSYPDNGLPFIEDNLPRTEFPPLGKLSSSSKK